MSGTARQPSLPARDSGRHRSAGGASVRRVRRTLAIVVPVIGVAGLVSLFLIPRVSTEGVDDAGGEGVRSSVSPVANTAVQSESESADSPDACPLGDRALRVVAAPDVVDLVRALSFPDAGTGDTGPLSSCVIDVSSQEPADALLGWQADPASMPDVWIPDSSLWPAMAAQAGQTLPATTSSVATSPVVMAVSAAAAQRLDQDGAALPSIDQILASRLSPDPIRFGIPDPQRSAAALGALVEARSTMAGGSGGWAALTWAMRSSPPALPIDDSQLMSRLTADPNTAVPVSEQAVWASNTTTDGTKAVAVYAGGDGPQLDFPYVTISPDPSTIAVATALLDRLLSTQGQQLFLANGFRDQGGHGGPALENTVGLDPQARSGSATTVSEFADTVRSFAISNIPSRLLAVLDVSGSMALDVPGAGGQSRLDLAKDAATLGLSLYPPNSQIGLWVFSRNLEPNSDHREMVPIGSLDATTDGSSGQQRISQALGAVTVNPDGGTGLYDTTLDAIRMMRADWDPHRVNIVLILSDGQNDDLGSITLDDLLTTLKKEQDPARPVPVIAIAFGPDSDIQAMQQISDTTGGATYIAQDPRDIREIFLDAVGQRLCRPNC